MRTWLTALLCVLILAGAAGLCVVIFSTEPTAEREGATRTSAMLVEVVQVRRGSWRPTIVSTGVVEPARDVVLAPRVGGEVVERSAAFTPGGVVAAGEALLTIDPADYEHVLEQRRSDLRRAEAAQALEQGRREVAERDFELLEAELAPRNQALVLREPQLETARAEVAAARAAVTQAELDLARTAVVAPFDAQVLSRDVDLGSQVTPGEQLGRLVGLDEYWVVTTVPLAKLRWLDVPRAPGDEGSLARIHHESAWAPGEFRTGSIARLIGSLDERTRLARLIVTVDDPLGRRTPEPESPPLMLGAYVEVRLLGRELTDVVRLPRAHLRQGDTVWVLEDDVLRVRPVTVELRDEAHAYVSAGLEDGDRVVTTSLSTVVDGAPLRVDSDTATRDGDTATRDGGDA